MHAQNTRMENSSKYDRIFKENIDAMLPNIAKSMLNFGIVQKYDLPSDIQHTKERKPDFLKKIKDSDGKYFILHIECQTKEDRDMEFRMAEYYIMLRRRYRLPVIQYVLFLGEQAPRMVKLMTADNFNFNYEIVTYIDTNYELLLKSSVPEDKVFSILCNFKHDDPALIIKRIIDELREVSADLAYGKYIRQLSILAQLRELTHLIKIDMKSDPRLVIEKNAFFQIGEERGELRGITQTAIKLREAGIPYETIAKVTDFSVEEIGKLELPK
ncbi:hypothetical protein ACSBL2_05790 [Pedobacter sp. AW31-3R]|uniref:hypothetical protein n=1 Tax=Pedobacter sp. AW31-3R TaxID=3445781 RepID=UPI003F9F0C30